MSPAAGRGATALARAGAACREAADIARAHPRHLLLFSLVAGLLCGGWAPWLASVPATVGLLVAGRVGVAVGVVAIVFAGAGLATARRAAIDSGPLPAAFGRPVSAELTVLEPPRVRVSGEVVARASVDRGPAAGETVLLRARDRTHLPEPLDPGDIVAVRGWAEQLRPFDEFQRRRGALAAVSVKRLHTTGRVRAGPLGALDAIRRRAERGLGSGLAPERSALLAGMVLGRDDAIAPETIEAFQASGLAHLLAVSGTNVMLLATLVLAGGALVGASLRRRLLAALVLVSLYVPLTGAGPSIQRAGVMGAAGLVAALAGRPASRAYALGLAAAVTLGLNPYAAGEPGWQLSFAAVAGLMWLGPPLRAWLERHRLPAPLLDATALTLAATVVTAPLLAVHFERVSLVSLPSNLVAAPVVAPIMWLGMLAAAVAQASPGVAAPLNALNDPLLGFVEGTAAVAASVPHAVVGVRLTGFAGALAGYAALVAGWLALRAWSRRRRVRAPRRPCRGRRHHGLQGRRVARGPAVAAAAVLAAAGAMAVAGPAGSPATRPGETVVSFLDVGQGDATLVERDGVAVLFDTGPPEGRVVSRLREAGVRRLDALVVTHAQLDHEGGTLAVLERFRPRLVVDGGAGWPTPVQRALPRAAAAVGARVVTAAAGDVLRLGRLTVRILSPPAAQVQAPPEGDPNDRALVAHVASGEFDVLLMADAETDVTGGLDLPQAEALKVAHHGSADPGLPAQLARVRPAVAGIEVGRGNSYGHPAPSTLSALRVVPQVVRTDRDGTVRLRAGPQGITIERLGRSRVAY